jgi:hypothetical protein
MMPKNESTKQQYQSAEVTQNEFATVFQENDPITAPAIIAHWKL